MSSAAWPRAWILRSAIAYLSKGRQKSTPCCGFETPPLRGFIPASLSSAGTKALPSSMSERSSMAAAAEATAAALIVGDSGVAGADAGAGL